MEKRVMEKRVRFAVPGPERPVTRWWAAQPENNISIEPAHRVPLPPTRRSRKRGQTSLLKQRSTGPEAGTSNGRASITVRSVDFSTTSAKISCQEVAHDGPDVIALRGVKSRTHSELDMYLKSNSYDGQMKKRNVGSLYEGIYANTQKLTILSAQGLCMQDELTKEAKKGRRNVTEKTSASLMILVVRFVSENQCLKVALLSSLTPENSVKGLALRKVAAVRRQDILPTLVLGLRGNDAASGPGRFWLTMDKLKLVSEVPSIPLAAGDLDFLPPAALSQATFALIQPDETNGEDAQSDERNDQDGQSDERRDEDGQFDESNGDGLSEQGTEKKRKKK